MAEVKATRDGYGEALLELGSEEPRVAVVDADLFRSTRTDRFAEAFPDRFFEIGIAEQDMVSTAVGLALGGMIPFANSFAVFLTGRAFVIDENLYLVGKAISVETSRSLTSQPLDDNVQRLPLQL